jgi:ribulose-phosphate 3-epimerase
MELIVPAVLPTSREELEEKLALLSKIDSVSIVQIDVVDGRFASPISWPYTAPKEFLEMVENNEMLPHLDRIAYEIDLMCNDAERMAEAWLAMGATRLTFHAESTTNIARLLASARKRYGSGAGFVSDLISFGVAINIASELSLIEPCLHEVKYVQFMGIARIGRQGQPFDHRVIDKLKTFHAKYPNIVLQVDGGVTLENARQLLALDVNNLVVGSALLKAHDPAIMFNKFEELLNPYGV